MTAILTKRLAALAWLIANGHLEVRLAICPNGALYHEKIGVFHDAAGDLVAFTGSSNETAAGLAENFESIRVLPGWGGTADHAREIAADFEALWADRTPGVRVLDVTACAKELLARYRQGAPPAHDRDLDFMVVPPRRGLHHDERELPLRPHQIAAREAWIRAEGRGIFAMATGAGKTITALAAAARLAELLLRGHIRLAVVLILCPYRNLVTQWRDEAARFGIDPILAFESRQGWFAQVQEALRQARTQPVDVPPAVIIGTLATFEGEAFQSLVSLLPEATLVIADECHHLGSRQRTQALPTRARYRLGLSATPERWGDEEGTRRLHDWFGKPLEPVYGLKEALADKVLTPYRYEPVIVHLDDDENAAYRELSQRIAQRMASGTDTDDEVLGALLRKRARVVALARAKLPALRAIVAPLGQRLHHALIYCGEGAPDDGSGPMVEQVAALLRDDLGLTVATYTADTDQDQREGIRRTLDGGSLNAVVAMRCLDEGVDIPSVQTAIIMASSGNPRQFIQRRGRVLRRHPGKERALIYDLVVCPDPDAVVDAATRSLLRAELRRLDEFASLAVNHGEIEGRLAPIRRTYEVWNA